MTPEKNVIRESETLAFSDKLAQLSNRERPILPKDITPEAQQDIKNMLESAGAVFELLPKEVINELYNPSNTQFRNLEEQRGLPISWIFAENAQLILDDIPRLFPDADRIISSKEGPIEGTQGRGVRHLLTIFSVLAISENPDIISKTVKELNTRVYSGSYKRMTPEEKAILGPHVDESKIGTSTLAKIPKNGIEVFSRYLYSGKVPDVSTQV